MTLVFGIFISIVCMTEFSSNFNQLYHYYLSDAAAAVGAGSSSGAGASASAGGADATAAAAAVGGADAAAMFARPSASRGRDSSAGESEASGFM